MMQHVSEIYVSRICDQMEKLQRTGQHPKWQMGGTDSQKVTCVAGPPQMISEDEPVHIK